MQRNPFQDVVPPEENEKKKMGQEVKRSVRDIPIMRKARPLSGKESMAPETPPPPSVFMHRDIPRHEEAYELPKQEKGEAPRFGYPPLNKPKRRFGSPKFYVGATILVLLGFVVLMMDAFTSAKVDIVPKAESVSFNTNLTISNIATSSALMYEPIELSAEETKDVPASGTEQVERKASAKITIYNNYSADPQRLIARTRFATPDGLIFRINDSVTVPGKSGDTPGSINVTLYADEAGDKYNIGLTDFTIPGFKDDSARYQAFYGRSDTKAEGGFVGTVKKISDADKTSAKTALDILLKADIAKDLEAKLDPSMVVLNGSIIYDFSDLESTDSSGDNAVVKESVKAYALSLKKSELSNLVETEFLTDWQKLPAEISSYDGLSMVLSDSHWMPSDGATSITLFGTTTMIASIDKTLIISHLSGKSKSELSNIVNTTPAIISAKAVVRPIWKSRFPDNPEKISVIITPQ